MHGRNLVASGSIPKESAEPSRQISQISSRSPRCNKPSRFRIQISDFQPAHFPNKQILSFPKRWRSTEAENLIGRNSPHRIGNLFRATNKFGNLLSTSRFWFSRKQIHKLRRIYKTGQIFFKIFFVYNVIMWADSRFLWEQIPKDNFLSSRLKFWRGE